MLPSPDQRIDRGLALPAGLHADPHARLAEANHRIANNLSLIVGLIRAQADTFSGHDGAVSRAEVSRLLADVAARIDAVGQLHRLLSAGPERLTVDLADYLARVCEAVAGFGAAPTGMRLATCFTSGCRLRPDQILPLALIVSEAVTNAIKYAHPAGAPGQVEVSCHRESDGRLLVEVRDDGVGLPEGFDAAGDGGLGLRVVRGLAQQLGAELRLESSCLGLSVQVRMPPVAYTAA